MVEQEQSKSEHILPESATATELTMKKVSWTVMRVI